MYARKTCQGVLSIYRALFCNTLQTNIMGPDIQVYNIVMYVVTKKLSGTDFSVCMIRAGEGHAINQYVLQWQC